MAVLLIMCSLLAALAYILYLHKSIVKVEKKLRKESLYHLAASFGHEMRQPLTVIQGMLQLIREETINERQREYLETAMNELNRSEQMIQDYQLYADPFFGKKEPVHIRTEIQDVVSRMRPFMKKNNVEIRLKLDEGAVHGERLRLNQCFWNICENAVESMKNGGTLAISMHVNKKQVRVTFSDTGAGMTKEQIKRLGEPYFSLAESKGTGLGMMTAARIIEGIGGHMIITSEKGKGTVVKVSLPSDRPVE
ncbi:sensor histidine kinase [Domibacillus iocasae]|uniref:histidine kinase n=1 Tax=Domibacillus iocasae TaxID=1714016 RepID=A0A1E7DUA7_9BACI|nr:HAMP domain-containing sensor histidine kinase [Domibacillus iocasae]OES46666.1 hypothetical protein BA724_00995 [Domibacillus iocasae]